MSMSLPQAAEMIDYNVGSKIFTIFTEVIDDHPHSKLAMIASKVWNTVSDIPGGECANEDNTSSEHTSTIFFNDNAVRFEFVVNYLSNGGPLQLPPNVPKEAIIDNLDQYGIDYDVDDMHDRVGDVLLEMGKIQERLEK